MRRWQYSLATTFLFVLVLPTFAAGQQQVLWPDADHPVLRFTFGKFRNMVGPVGNQRPYAFDAIAENLSNQQIGNDQFVLYIFDQKQIRVADASMDIANLAPGQSVKLQVTIMATGSPASIRVMSLAETRRPIALTVNSSPQGALLKVDGAEAGTTPKVILVGPGKHELTFSKDGFRVGVFPLEIGANDASGGAINFELAALPFDTIELRDGTVLSGDLESIEGMEVVVRVGDTLQRIDRNNVQRILLAQREAPAPSDLHRVKPKH